MLHTLIETIWCYHNCRSDDAVSLPYRTRSQACLILLPSDGCVLQAHPALSTDALRLMKRIRDGVVGNSEHCAIDGPFGARPLVYADYIASGR